MLNSCIVNSLDAIIINYLWTCLTRENTKIYKLVFSIVSSAILLIITKQLGFNFIVPYIGTIIILKIVYEKNIKEVILEFFLVILIDMILQLIISLIVSRFVYSYTLRGISIELIILISLIILSKTKLFNKKIDLKNVDSNVLIYLISIFSVYAIVFKVGSAYDNSIIFGNILVDIVILSILVTSQILIYLHIIKVIKEKEKFEILNEYNTVVDEIVQEIKRRQHDFVNYKNTISGMIEVLDEKEVKQAITNYINDEDIYDNNINELIYIDNIVIKSIIYRNICRAKKHSVNFEYQIENDVLDHILSYHEVSNILNNLLNNAFDEVMKSDCTKKNIQIKILTKNNTAHLIIKNQIMNSNNINLNKIFKKGYSTKSTSSRGYGLYNVKQIVNLHKGYIKIKVEFGEIILDIYFNNSLDKAHKSK